MTKKILISAPYFQPVVDRFIPMLREQGMEVVVPPVNERLEEDALLDVIGDIDGVICGDDRFTEKVLRAAPKLKVISKWGTGIDSINQEICRELGIAVCNTPNAFTKPVSDSVMAYMLCFARKTPWMDTHMKEGVWEKIPGMALHELTLGIVGVGNIGRAVALKAQAFGMRVLGNDIIEIDEAFIQQSGIEMVEKDELYRMSDIISLNCDLNPTSCHVINQKSLQLMERKPVVINTARGPLVKEIDLIEALQRGQISGAALDVFEDEPLPQDSPLKTMANVLLAPHNSNSSPAAWENVHTNTVNNLLKVLNG